MFQEIYIVDETEELIKLLRNVFKQDRTFRFKNVKAANIETALKNIPDLILIAEDNINIKIEDLCSQIRGDEDNSITPIMVISSKTDKKHKLSVLKSVVEYFIECPIDEKILYYTIKNITRLLSSNRTVSPLTGLPRKCTNTSRTKKESSK